MKNVIKEWWLQSSAVIVLVTLITILAFKHDLPADTKQSFFGICMLCAGFLWGSSVGSQKKDNIIANSTPNKDATITE